MLTTKYRIATTLEEVDHKLKLVQLPGYIEMIKVLQRVQLRFDVMTDTESISARSVPSEIRHEFTCMRAEIANVLAKTKIS